MNLVMTFLTDYSSQWVFAVSLCVFFFCVRWVRPRFGHAVSMLLLGASASTIWCSFFQYNRYFTVDPYNQTSLRYFSCDAICKVFMIVVPLMLFAENRQQMKLVGMFSSYAFILANCLVCFYEACFGCGGNRCGGIIGNPSISLGLVVSMLPVAMSIYCPKWKWMLPVMVMAALYFGQSSIGIGLFAVYGALALFFKDGRFSKRLSLSGSVFASAMLGGYFVLKDYKGLFHDSDRFKVWTRMMEHWMAPWNLLTGTGLGTYHVFSINIQKVDPMTGSDHGRLLWWNTLHNEVLQFTFECGCLGLLLFLWVYGAAVWKTFREKDWPIFMSIVLYGLYMTMDPALHNPLPSLFGAWLFVYALRTDPKKEYLCEP